MAANYSVVLAGPPADVSGLVPYHNATDKDVVVEQVLVRDPDSGEATLQVDPVTVAPGRTARIGVRLSLQPQTAAGAYPLEVTIAGVGTSVVAHVAETRDLVLSPEALIVDNLPGEAVTRQVIVLNQGNVTVFVADYGDVPLYREDTALGTLLAIARTSPLQVPGPIEPLPEPASTMSVTTGGGRVTILPGESRAVELTITIPADLSQSARYLTTLPISVRTLLVAVVPAGVEQ